jgi:glycosyltransferase involved in cell wall biosynthesis
MNGESLNMSGNHPKVLVLSLPPFLYATRGRKAAESFAKVTSTAFLGLEAAGRSGRRHKPGNFVFDGVSVHQVRVAMPRTSSSAFTQIWNLVFVFLPAFVRMLRVVLRTHAEVVYISHPTLCILGAIHQWRFKSRLIVDLPERPGLVTARGALISKFTRIEPTVLRWMGPRVEMATVVVPSDVEPVKALGYKNVTLVRNVPLAAWRADYRPPAPRNKGPLEAVIISSIFENRGFEMIIKAIAICNRSSTRVRLRVYGPASDRYLASLQRATDEAGVGEVVSWCGNIDATEVSDAYLRAHVGLVLYESTHPGNDGLSNKILQCVSSGRPVLASDLPENRAFVSSGGVGWLSETTAESLAAGLESIAEIGSLDDISLRCRELGDKELTWEHEFGPVQSLVV